jgi:Fe-S cluster assembly protein SufD
VITETKVLASYLDAFTEFEKRAAGKDSQWLRSSREAAFARFAEVGFPTIHDEDWRFTSVAAVAQTSWQLASKAQLTKSQVNRFCLSDSCCQLVFVNGWFSPELSSLPSLPTVEVGSLANVISREPNILEARLAKYADIQRDPFCALNTAFIDDGAYVYVHPRAVIEEPIHLLYISIAADAPAMIHPRNLIVAGEDSQISVIEDYVSVGSGTAFTNAVTELIAGQNSVVAHTMLEREGDQTFIFSTLRIQQERSASVASHSVLLGGALVRNNVHPVLAGEGADCLINGLFIGHGRQHMDNYMRVEHASPHCNSRQFYNGILDGQSHGVFHGRIIVHKDAQKTDAKQTNRNLLLSDSAQIDTKPQLEIYADDVKCTHGATIGQIDEEALFYMRSRGLEEQGARRLLLFAFASECLERMKPGPVRTMLENLVKDSLPQGEISAGRLTESERHWEEVG